MHAARVLFVCLFVHSTILVVGGLREALADNNNVGISNQLRSTGDVTKDEHGDYFIITLIDRTIGKYQLKNSLWKEKMEKEINNMKKQIEDLKSTQGSGGSEVYVRWGSKTCPKNTTELVYSGFAAGANQHYHGGSAAPVCLHPRPIMNETKPTAAHFTFILGTEYQLYGTNSKKHDHDVPCAVCRTNGHSTVHMTPGTDACEENWTLEYNGYLMAGHYKHKGNTDFVCVDKNMDTLSGGHGNKDGQLFFYVTPSCGSLPCPPYMNGNNLYLFCAVCSK